MSGYTATFSGGTLDYGLGEGDPFHPTRTVLAEAGVPSDSDGLVVTVLGVAGEPSFDSGQPSSAAVVGVPVGATALCIVATTPMGGLVCGTSANAASSQILEAEDGRTTWDTWVVVTPITAGGQVAGESVIVQVPVEVLTTAEEMYEAQQEMDEDGRAQVGPAHGDTFVVMEDVDDIRST